MNTMMKKIFFLCILNMILLSACSKDKEEQEPIIPDNGIPLVYAESTYAVKVEKLQKKRSPIVGTRKNIKDVMHCQKIFRYARLL